MVDAWTLIAAVVAVAGIAAAAMALASDASRRRRLRPVVERLGIAGSANLGAALDRRLDEIESELAASRGEAARLRLALEETDLGVLVTNRRGEVVFGNPAADRVMEGRQGDAVARSRVQQLIDRVAAGGGAEELELDLYTPVRRILRLRAVPLGDGGSLVYIADLTDRHRIEAIRRDFVANAGHELKTPLGALSVLAETLADADDPSVRAKLADRLRSEASRMARLVDDILELATIESLETPHTAVAVADVLAEAEASVALRAERAGVALVAKISDEDLVVSGDRKQLVSAVTNLFDNAVKYTTAGGDGGTVWYRAWREGPWVVIDVEDHGIGIAEQHLERVFERFYRVDRGRGRSSGGTGLGLSIVRNVARTHGGEVTVRSELGVGSTFTIRLPAARE